MDAKPKPTRRRLEGLQQIKSKNSECCGREGLFWKGGYLWDSPPKARRVPWIPSGHPSAFTVTSPLSGSNIPSGSDASQPKLSTWGLLPLFECLSASKGRVRGDEKDLNKYFSFFMGVTQLLNYKPKSPVVLKQRKFQISFRSSGFNFVITVEC